MSTYLCRLRVQTARKMAQYKNLIEMSIFELGCHPWGSVITGVVCGHPPPPPSPLDPQLLTYQVGWWLSPQLQGISIQFSSTCVHDLSGESNWCSWLLKMNGFPCHLRGFLLIATVLNQIMQCSLSYLFDKFLPTLFLNTVIGLNVLMGDATPCYSWTPHLAGFWVAEWLDERLGFPRYWVQTLLE